MGAMGGGGLPPLPCPQWVSDTTYYVRGQDGRVLAEYADLGGQPTARYIYAGSNKIAMIDSLDNVYYYINDHLGSAGVLIASDGTVRDKYRYKPFGGMESGQSVNVGQSYRYTGQPIDEELDMDWYYYGARYYDPEIGRFLAVDPAAAMYSSHSPYSYCGNNPINYLDVNGEWWILAQRKTSYMPLDTYKGEIPVTFYLVMWNTPAYNIASGLPVVGWANRSLENTYKPSVGKELLSATQELIAWISWPQKIKVLLNLKAGYDVASKLDDPRLIKRFHQKYGYKAWLNDVALIAAIEDIEAELSAEDAAAKAKGKQRGPDSDGTSTTSTEAEETQSDNTLHTVDRFWIGWGPENN